MYMSRTRVLLVAAAALTLVAASPAWANLILNGDFENNTAGSSQWNLSNAQFTATVANATGFGGAQEIDLILGQGPYGGSPPQSGSWKLAIHAQPTGLVDAFSLDLSPAVVAGNTYTLVFYAENVPFFDPNNGPVEVGLSSSATAFGTLVYSGLPGRNGWTQLSHTFVAPVGASYLTVRNDPSVTQVWHHIDNFSLTTSDVIPEPTTIALLALGGLGLWRRRRTR